MESIILMNSKWGNDIFVPMYLFFGGLSGGLFVIAVAADLLGIKFKQFEKFSRLTSYLVLPVLALAGAFIAFHLGKPERGILFPFFFKNYDSWLVIGGWRVGGVTNEGAHNNHSSGPFPTSNKSVSSSQILSSLKPLLRSK